MTAPPVTTRPATAAELDEVAELCATAFADEAVIAWVLPDPRTRREHLRGLFGASLGAAVDAQALILALADDRPIGASIWVPRSGVAEAMEPSAPDDPVARRLLALRTATDTRHPDRPHLYLQSMAVRPEHRRRGAGAAMITSGLTRASELDLPVYLEASTPGNRTLYGRHGFHDQGDPIRPWGEGPSLQPMWRDNRPA